MLLLRSSVQAELYPGCAGEEAVQYFERTNPEYPRFGAGSTSDNHAEWIVDLTTKACPCHADTLQLALSGGIFPCDGFAVLCMNAHKWAAAMWCPILAMQQV